MGLLLWPRSKRLLNAAAVAPALQTLRLHQMLVSCWLRRSGPKGFAPHLSTHGLCPRHLLSQHPAGAAGERRPGSGAAAGSLSRASLLCLGSLRHDRIWRSRWTSDKEDADLDGYGSDLDVLDGYADSDSDDEVGQEIGCTRVHSGCSAAGALIHCPLCLQELVVAGPEELAMALACHLQSAFLAAAPCMQHSRKQTTSQPLLLQTSRLP